MSLNISIPPHVKETISSEIEITSIRTGQKDKIGFYYNQGAYVETPSSPFLGLNLTLADFALLFIFIVVIFSLIKSMKNYSNTGSVTNSGGVGQVPQNQFYTRQANTGYTNDYFGKSFHNTSTSDTPMRGKVLFMSL